MLTTHLNNKPLTKFLLINDTAEQRAKDMLDYIVRCRMKETRTTIKYFFFEGNFDKARKCYGDVTLYDCASDARGWICGDGEPPFKSVISETNTPTVLVIDSLAHVVFEYGFKEAYRILNNLTHNNCVTQIITVLHTDMLEDQKIIRYFQHIATLSLTLETTFKSDNPRVLYTYKKPGGKLIKEVEEFRFEGGLLKTEAVKKLDPKLVVEESVKEISPDSLTTFKISLEEDEKKARDNLVLPYLPKEATGEGGGKIFYQFDEADDWDEEDPDDDLDI